MGEEELIDPSLKTIEIINEKKDGNLITNLAIELLLIIIVLVNFGKLLFAKI